MEEVHTTAILTDSSDILIQKETEGNKMASILPHKKVFDLGKLRAGEITKHQLGFVNNSEDTLWIKGTRPSCSCVVATDYPRIVPPKENGTLTILFDTKGNSIGEHTKTITVLTNTKYKASFRFKAKIVE